MAKKKSLEWRDCSEAGLAERLDDWLKSTFGSTVQNFSDCIFFLEGEMGAGKSTFVRALLRLLVPEQASAGSPTFPISQTYRLSTRVSFHHIDVYRLKTEAELTDSGIEAQLEEPHSVSCVEWASLFETAFQHWFNEPKLTKKRVFVVQVWMTSPEFRNYEITEF